MPSTFYLSLKYSLDKIRALEYYNKVKRKTKIEKVVTAKIFRELVVVEN
jgi:hypothetical protein